MREWPQLNIIAEECTPITSLPNFVQQLFSSSSLVPSNGSNLSGEKRQPWDTHLIDRRKNSSKKGSLFSNVPLSEVTLFVDPIDGTKELVCGDLRCVVMMIGINVNNIPVAGVLNQLFGPYSNAEVVRRYQGKRSATNTSDLPFFGKILWGMQNLGVFETSENYKNFANQYFKNSSQQFLTFRVNEKYWKAIADQEERRQLKKEMKKAKAKARLKAKTKGKDDTEPTERKEQDDTKSVEANDTELINRKENDIKSVVTKENNDIKSERREQEKDDKEPADPKETEFHQKTLVTSFRNIDLPLLSVLESLSTKPLLRVSGSGYKAILIIQKKAHAFVFKARGTKKWDTCAPQALISELGGCFTDLDGQTISYPSVSQPTAPTTPQTTEPISQREHDIQYANRNGLVVTLESVYHDFLVETISTRLKHSKKE
eukprot:TRINITY_DN4631_c0_g1_i1.p1 TRINITY_DN4631_c0_g1~~TRINITY_DN4631_c0_g1_i1.p1  ORF type:complete len:430 (-),score=92.92 TRINITY_DN4631_c0_g1_i1:51-1340(-)